MCGIAGIFRKTLDYPVTPDNISKTLASLQVRGSDATGIAWKRGDSNLFSILRAPLPAEEFITYPEFEKYIGEITQSNVILMHTRQATSGSYLNNRNNHPIFNQNGLIIHNGVVHVPKWLTAHGQTDTEQIMNYIQTYGFEAGLDKVDGSMAFAYVDFSNKTSYVYAETSPMMVFFEQGTFIFGSTDPILKDGLALDVAKTRSLPEKTLYEVTQDCQLKEKIKIKRVYSYGGTSYYSGGAYQGLDGYDDYVLPRAYPPGRKTNELGKKGKLLGNDSKKFHNGRGK